MMHTVTWTIRLLQACLSSSSEGENESEVLVFSFPLSAILLFSFPRSSLSLVSSFGATHACSHMHRGGQLRSICAHQVERKAALTICKGRGLCDNHFEETDREVGSELLRPASRFQILWSEFLVDGDLFDWSAVQGKTPLIRAAEHGKLEEVHLMLLGGARKNARDRVCIELTVIKRILLR